MTATLQLSPDKFKELFPHASTSTIEANSRPQIQDTEQSEQTSALVFGDEGKTPRPGCPLIGFTLFRVHLLDWEAKYSSVKDLLDGLRYAGLVCGDREEEIDPQSYVRQVKVAHYRDERTEILIQWPEE